MVFIISGILAAIDDGTPGSANPATNNYDLASMWTNPPGGLPGAAEVGNWIAQIICARDRKQFVTIIP